MEYIDVLHSCVISRPHLSKVESPDNRDFPVQSPPLHLIMAMVMVMSHTLAPFLCTQIFIGVRVIIPPSWVFSHQNLCQRLHTDVRDGVG